MNRRFIGHHMFWLATGCSGSEVPQIGGFRGRIGALSQCYSVIVQLEIDVERSLYINKA
jgi:hypothetical protein